MIKPDTGIGYSGYQPFDNEASAKDASH